MRLTAHKADAINRMGGRLRETLKRCDPEIPDSQRLMIVGLVKESLTKAYTGRTEIHPGIAKLAKWGRCSERTAQRNLREIEALGVAVPISDKVGGKRATRYWVDPLVLIHVMMVKGANPHPDLMSEIRDHVEAVRGDTRGDTRGDVCRDTCHPDTRRVSKPVQRASSSRGGK